ncbi:MAG: response regulator, partial [Polyangiaceae bacterium]
MKPTLLVVDDKPNMLSLLSKVLRGSARVVTARGVGTALAVLEREQVHTVLCDLRMTDGDGLELLHAIRARWQDVPFILMTAYATVATAVHAMQGGAFDYVTKPFDADVLKDKVERALAQGLTSVEARSSEATRFGPLVGGAPAMLRAYSTIERVAASD